MISVKNLTKNFGNKTAVSDISFELESGGILGFLGPNGAGKTTTMRVLTGFFPPTSGTALINGVDVCEEPLRVREMVGYLPEQVPLYRDMTTREFLYFAASAKKVKSSERKEAVERTLARCNLESVADQLIGTISRGFRQRVGLGQAIVNDPSVLILDEPTVGLDPTQVRDIRALLRELAKDSTVILSSHILSEVQQMCSRVVIISDGKVRASGTPEELAGALVGDTRVQVKVVGATNEEIESALLGIEGVKGVTSGAQGVFQVTSACGGPELNPAISSLVVGAGWELHELTTSLASLEDTFIQLIDTGGVKA